MDVRANALANLYSYTYHHRAPHLIRSISPSAEVS
jgi:hypothetical protein